MLRFWSNEYFANVAKLIFNHVFVFASIKSMRFNFLFVERSISANNTVIGRITRYTEGMNDEMRDKNEGIDYSCDPF